MANENDNGNLDDLFPGDAGTTTQVMEPPNRLERTIGNERVERRMVDPVIDVLGGFSPEAHRDTLNKVRQARRQRSGVEEEADKYWARNDRAIAETMGIAPGRFRSAIYDLLSHAGMNLYKRDALKASRQFQTEAQGIQRDVDKLQHRLEGKVEYVSPIAGESAEVALQQRKYVREADKGLRYRLAEATDDARILGIQYRNGLHAIARYRAEITSIDEDIGKIQADTSDPAASAKVSALQSKRNQLDNEKQGVDQQQRDYERELITYEKRMDRLQAKIKTYECITRKGNAKLSAIYSAIEILDDYVRERDDLRSVHDLLLDLQNLDEKHQRINTAIEQYDGIVGDQLEHLSKVVESNDVEYSTRPLMRQVDTMNKQDQVIAQKDIGRIMGKLGIPI